ncbi:extracellular solute-binding protein [Enterococcus sp. LJL98]
MGNKTKWFASLLGIALTSSLLVGCGSSENKTVSTDKPEENMSESKANDKEKVELTVWQTSRNVDEFADEQEKEFLEEHPWITLNKVVKEGDPGNEFYQAVAAGTAPDFIEASFTVMDKFISAGIAESLNPYLDKWEDTKALDTAYLDMFKKNDNYYGLPIQVNPMLFGYNKKLLNEQEIETVPTTWEEALEVAKKVNNPDKQITGYATLTAEWTDWFFQYYVWQAGGDLTQQNPDGTATLTFTDPAVIKAANYYQELAKNKVLQSDRTLKFGDLLTQFSQDKISLMPFATDWVVDVSNNGMDIDNLGLALPPAGPAGKQTTAIAGTTYVINAKTDQAKKDAAWEYISWYSSKEQRSAHYENLASKGSIAPVMIPRTDMKITDFAEFPEEYNAVLDAVSENGRLEFYGKADFGTYVDRAVQAILANPNADAEKEFAAAQELAEKEALPGFNEANFIE